MTALAAASTARWRCSTCERFVPGRLVELDPETHEPVGYCDGCAEAVPVLFERVAAPQRREPADRREVGQDVSLLGLDEVARPSFLAVVASVPAGELVSVNTVRSRLDALETPPRARGALFREAVRLGLLVPVFVEDGGVRVAAREPSTGTTANLASVRLYRRTEKALAPS